MQCFEGKKIPEDFITLYKWHNGQVDNYSLNQNDNFTFLPISEVVSSWQFLNDPMEDIFEPVSKSWIPIAYNGAGNFLVYEIETENAGTIIEYLHDNQRRKVKYVDLFVWVKSAIEATKSSK